MCYTRALFQLSKKQWASPGGPTALFKACRCRYDVIKHTKKIAERARDDMGFCRILLNTKLCTPVAWTLSEYHALLFNLSQAIAKALMASHFPFVNKRYALYLFCVCFLSSLHKSKPISSFKSEFEKQQHICCSKIFPSTIVSLFTNFR